MTGAHMLNTMGLHRPPAIENIAILWSGRWLRVNRKSSRNNALWPNGLASPGVGQPGASAELCGGRA